MNIANSCTFLRLLFCPLFLILYLYPDSFGVDPRALPFVLIAFFVLSELSDAFDGWIARRFNQVTDLGKLMDPMADSIYRISLFLTFTQPPVNLPIWIVFLFLYRDICVSTLRTICALKGFTLAARLSGKLKATLQAAAAFAILLLMIPHSTGALSGEELTSYSTLIGLSVALFAFVSGVDYFFSNRIYLYKMLKSSA